MKNSFILFIIISLTIIIIKLSYIIGSIETIIKNPILEFILIILIIAIPILFAYILHKKDK